MYNMRKMLLFGCALVALVLARPVWSQSMVHSWSQSFGDTGDDRGARIAADGAGDILLTGLFEGTVDFGGGAYHAAGGTDIFIAKYNGTGSHLWSHCFGNTGLDWGQAIAADAAGNVLVGGTFERTVSVGGDMFTSAGSADIFVAKYDGAGTHIWSHSFGAGGLDRCHSIAVDGAGNVLITGTFAGTVDFGGGPLTSVGGHDIYVAKYDGAGTHLWSHRFGASGEDRGIVIKVDGDGNVLVTGYFQGTVSFGGISYHAAGGTDIFIAKYDGTGMHIWSKAFGDSSDDQGLGIARDGDGSIFVTGYFQGTVDFGGGPLTSVGGHDIYVAKYDEAGTHLWSRCIGDASNDEGEFIAVDGTGNVVVTGFFEGVVDFGGGPRTSAGGRDIYVAKYDGNGAHLWSQRYGADAEDQGRGIAVDGAGNVLVTGFFGSVVDFGGGPHVCAGFRDIFMAKYSEIPIGVTVQASRSYWAWNHVEVAWRLIDIGGDLSFVVSRAKVPSESLREQEGADVYRRGDDFIYEDHTAEPGTTYRYQVVILKNGEATTSFETEVATPAATFSLNQNHPNPFNPLTSISYYLPEKCRVRLEIYDGSGRRIASLVNREQEEGRYAAEWNGKDERGNSVASGVFFCRLTAGKQTITRKMVLLR